MTALELSWTPIFPYTHLIVFVAWCGAVVVIQAVWSRRQRSGDVGRRAYKIAAATGLLAALALTLAAFDPSIAPRQVATTPELIVVLDVSESEARTDGQLEATSDRVAALLTTAIRALPSDLTRVATGRVVRFANDAVATSTLPLVDLPTAVTDLSARRRLQVDGTNLDAGLRLAAEAAADSHGITSVLLVSDGLDTTGQVGDTIVRLARAGIPVSVLPASSPNPGAGLVAAYLPRQVRAERDATLRLVVRNTGLETAQLQLQWSLSGLPSQIVPAVVAAGGWQSLRAPVVFSGRGIHALDVHLHTAGNERSQQRRLYTLVTTPPRILIAGDSRVIQRALTTRDYHVSFWQPGTPLRGDEFDAVVIDGLSAERFDDADLELLARSVTELGTGLLLVNGRHAGGDADPTILKSYDGTPLEPLLPLTSKPRTEVREPPPRDITILIDTSGSMAEPLGGRSRLDRARSIAQVIISRLNWRDRASIIAFADGFDELLRATEMGQTGKQAALAALSRLHPGGGTDPTAALQVIANRAVMNCGLFFISDAEFFVSLRQPGCMTTFFSIDNPRPGDNVRQLGEVHVVDSSFDPERIQLGFFDPKPRTKTFEPGTYRPDWLGRGKELWPTTPLPLDGTVVTYPRDDADIVAVRPWPLDPVLAFRRQGPGTVGEITTGLGGPWFDDVGTTAVAAWINSLLSWRQRDRYELAIDEVSGRLIVKVSVLADSGDVPDRIAASLDLLSGATLPLSLEADSTTWGVFRGEVALPATSQQSAAMLSLREVGQLRSERIPFQLPPPLPRGLTSAESEAWSFGLDETLLRSIADRTGGVYDVTSERLFSFMGGTRAPPRRLLRPWLLLAAMVFYLLQIAALRLLSP